MTSSSCAFLSLDYTMKENSHAVGQPCTCTTMHYIAVVTIAASTLIVQDSNPHLDPMPAVTQANTCS